MLTFLSRSLRRVLNKQRALPPHASPLALLPARSLRLVRGEDNAADIPVVGPGAPAVAFAGLPGAAVAFVAGQGARIYSLEAFRRMASPARPPQRAA